MALGNRLKAERKRLGLSQEALGARGGVATNAQGNYEGDKRTPDANYLAGVSAAGVDVLYVLTGQKTLRDIDLTTFGICEAALRQAYKAVRPKSPESIAFRTRHVCRLYNQVVSDPHSEVDLIATANASAERMIEGANDPADPSELDRVLIHPAMRANSTLNESGSYMAIGSDNARVAGRDFIHEERPKRKKK
jgi:transcriptional regulator with XRE-family HTH domain